MISVVITAYNAEEYVADAVKSILAQTEADLECVIVDDGSTDDTVRVLTDFGDPRIRLIEAGRIGRVRALNLGVRESRGEYVAIQDADDLSHPKRLEIQRLAMEQSPDYCAVGSPPFAFYANGRPDWPSFGPDEKNPSLADIGRKLMLSNIVNHTSLFARSEAMKKIQGYDEKFHMIHDFDLLVRMYENGMKVGLLKVPVAAKRIHEEQFFERNTRLRDVFDGILVQSRAIRACGGGLPYRVLLPFWFSYRLLPPKARMWIRAKGGYFSHADDLK